MRDVIVDRLLVEAEARDAEILRLQDEVRRVRLDHITTLGELQVAGEVVARLNVENDGLGIEVKRLRAAGDGLAKVALGVRPWVTPLVAMVERERIDEALAVWNDVSRGCGVKRNCVKDSSRLCVSWETCGMSDECYYDFRTRKAAEEARRGR